MTYTSVPEQIRSPSLLASLPNLDWSECRALADTIRDFLVESVSITGGHLGANLGTVELTIALHRHYRSPYDRIIFDTGHQAYTHKVLTGRLNGFARLRQRNGMSGFPSRSESGHDLLENSHASVGPAWALGVALARRRRTVVVLGDGALTGGVAYEALNAIGFYQVPVTVILNDNGRSYAPTVSRLTAGEPEESPTGSCNAARDFFHALGFAYLGPVDGHDFRSLDEVLESAVELSGPVVAHVRTQKGRDWSPAISDGVKRLHDVSAPAPSAPHEERRTWGQAFGDLVCRMARRDERIQVITAAMPDTLNLLNFQREFPDRFHDVGICEQLAVALAAGLASEGKRPIFAVVATFVTRALDQLLNDVSLHRLPVVLVLDRAGVTGPDGPSHHGIYDVGLLRAIPGLRIFSPAGEDQLETALQLSICGRPGPSVIRYPKGEPLPGRADEPVTSLATRRITGSEACIIAHGPTVRIALEAAGRLDAEHEKPVTVWDVTQLHPLPPEVFTDALKHRAVVTVEDLVTGTGLGAELAPYLARHAGRRPSFSEIALPASFLPFGSRADILGEYRITSSEVVRRVLEELAH